MPLVVFSMEKMRLRVQGGQGNWSSQDTGSNRTEQHFKERILEICRTPPPQVLSGVLTRECVRGNSEARERPSKRTSSLCLAGESTSGTHTGPQGLFPQTDCKNTFIHRALSIQDGFASVVKNN